MDGLESSGPCGPYGGGEDLGLESMGVFRLLGVGIGELGMGGEVGANPGGWVGGYSKWAMGSRGGESWD